MYGTTGSGTYRYLASPRPDATPRTLIARGEQPPFMQSSTPGGWFPKPKLPNLHALPPRTSQYYQAQQTSRATLMTHRPDGQTNRPLTVEEYRSGTPALSHRGLQTQETPRYQAPPAGRAWQAQSEASPYPIAPTAIQTDATAQTQPGQRQVSSGTETTPAKLATPAQTHRLGLDVIAARNRILAGEHTNLALERAAEARKIANQTALNSRDYLAAQSNAHNDSIAINDLRQSQKERDGSDTYARTTLQCERTLNAPEEKRFTRVVLGYGDNTVTHLVQQGDSKTPRIQLGFETPESREEKRRSAPSRPASVPVLNLAALASSTDDNGDFTIPGLDANSTLSSTVSSMKSDGSGSNSSTDSTSESSQSAITPTAWTGSPEQSRALSARSGNGSVRAAATQHANDSQYTINTTAAFLETKVAKDSRLTTDQHALPNEEKKAALNRSIDFTDELRAAVHNSARKRAQTHQPETPN